MTNLKTNESLLNKLNEAARRPTSADELYKQRVSFIMGSLKDSSTVTRAKVTEVLAEHEGKRTAHK